MWEYRTLRGMVPANTFERVHQDKQGFYLPWRGQLRLHPESDWHKDDRVDAVIFDEEAGFWDLEFRVLNRLGLLGWEVATVRTIPVGHIHSPDFVYVLKRPLVDKGD